MALSLRLTTKISRPIGRNQAARTGPTPSSYNCSTNQFGHGIRIKQYPRSLETQREIAVHTAWLRETGILVPCQSSWNIPLLPVKKPGTCGSHESDSSRDTGVLCLAPESCVLQPPMGRGETAHLCFYMDRARGRLQQATYLDQAA